MKVQDVIEVCPRCKLGVIFWSQPGLPYCYACGGLEAGDRGIVYVRKIVAEPAPPPPVEPPLVEGIP